jgi:hypothetical protein
VVRLKTLVVIKHLEGIIGREAEAAFFKTSHKLPFLMQIQKVIDFISIRLLSVAILVNQIFAVLYNSA